MCEFIVMKDWNRIMQSKLMRVIFILVLLTFFFMWIACLYLSPGFHKEQIQFCSIKDFINSDFKCFVMCIGNFLSQPLVYLWTLCFFVMKFRNFYDLKYVSHFPCISWIFESYLELKTFIFKFKNDSSVSYINWRGAVLSHSVLSDSLQTHGM